MVEDLHRRRGVVDGWRQRPNGDVDHHANRERGILLDRPLHAERDHRSQTLLCFGADAVSSVHLHERRALRNEVTGGSGHDDETAMRASEASESARVDRLHGAGAAAPHDEAGRRARLVRRGNIGGCVGLCGSAHDVLEHAPARASNERCDCDRPQTLNGAVEEDEEEQDSRREEEPGERHSEVWDGVLLHPAQHREGERQRANQDREHRLEHAVAIEEPQVPGGERAGRHLDDQHADRNYEPGQPDTRTDDRGEHGFGRPGRVRPALGELEDRARFGRDDADEGAGDAAEDGKDPQAPLHILANTEAKAPAHPERLAALAVSARARKR